MKPFGRGRMTPIRVPSTHRRPPSLGVLAEALEAREKPGGPVSRASRKPLAATEGAPPRSSTKSLGSQSQAGCGRGDSPLPPRGARRRGGGGAEAPSSRPAPAPRTRPRSIPGPRPPPPRAPSVLTEGPTGRRPPRPPLPSSRPRGDQRFRVSAPSPLAPPAASTRTPPGAGRELRAARASAPRSPARTSRRPARRCPAIPHAPSCASALPPATSFPFLPTISLRAALCLALTLSACPASLL